jgi:hypothetical protein
MKTMNREETAAWNARASRLRAQNPVASVPAAARAPAEIWKAEYPRLVAEQRRLGASPAQAGSRAVMEFDRLYPGARLRMNGERTGAHFARIFRQ